MSLTERFGRADRQSQRAPGARLAGEMVDANDRQGGAVRRNPARGLIRAQTIQVRFKYDDQRR